MQRSHSEGRRVHALVRMERSCPHFHSLRGAPGLGRSAGRGCDQRHSKEQGPELLVRSRPGASCPRCRPAVPGAAETVPQVEGRSGVREHSLCPKSSHTVWGMPFSPEMTVSSHPEPPWL